MDLQAIYVKTAKGQEALATRAYKLPSRVRNLPVMVDGMATGEHLVETLQFWAIPPPFSPCSSMRGSLRSARPLRQKNPRQLRSPLPGNSCISFPIW
jgi:hypothetical protein